MNQYTLIGGCSTDEYCPAGHECKDHRCELQIGVIPLKKVVVTNAGPGTYKLTLVGDEGSSNIANCTTPELSGSGTFIGTTQLGGFKETRGCYQVRRPEL